MNPNPPLSSGNVPPRAEQTPSIQGALAALSISMLLSSLGTSIANVGLPTLTQAFGASLAQVQWVVLAYLLAITTLIVSAGRLGDITGRRRLLLGGVLVFTVASALCAAAPTLWLLIVARVAQGIGAAVMMALPMAFVADAIPKSRTGTAMGLLASMSAIGTSLGPTLGGLLISLFGWQAIFLVNVPLGVLAFILAGLNLPVDQPRAMARNKGLDFHGTVLLALTLALFAFSMTLGRGSFGWLNATLLAAAILGVALFVRTEMKAASPLIEMAMLRKPELGASLVASMLVSTVMMATLVVGPFYLSRGLELDAASVGVIMSVGPLVVALAGLPAGFIADRFGARRVTFAGLVTIAIGTVLLYASPDQFGVSGYLVPLVVITGGYAFFQTANNTEVMAGVPQDRRGVISGLLTLSRNLGLIAGASLMGTVFGFATGTIDISMARPEAIALGMHVTFAVAAVIIVAAIAIMTAAGSVAGHSRGGA